MVTTPSAWVGSVSGLIKVDTDTGAYSSWSGEEYEYLGEPCYAPRKASKGGELPGEIVVQVVTARVRDTSKERQ